MSYATRRYGLAKMIEIRKCDFDSLLTEFAKENAEKDVRSVGKIDSWARDRFTEANAEFHGEWYEYEFDQSDLARIRLHMNYEFDIPASGMMVRDAVGLPRFHQWVSDGKDKAFPRDTHLWLASHWYNNGGPDYRDMIEHEGCFILLDGIHRTLAWVNANVQTVRVFIAGKPDSLAK